MYHGTSYSWGIRSVVIVLVNHFIHFKVWVNTYWWSTQRSVLERITNTPDLSSRKRKRWRQSRTPKFRRNHNRLHPGYEVWGVTDTSRLWIWISLSRLMGFTFSGQLSQYSGCLMSWTNQQSGLNIRYDWNFVLFRTVKTKSGTHTASHFIGTIIFLSPVKRLWREADR